MMALVKEYYEMNRKERRLAEIEKRLNCLRTERPRSMSSFATLAGYYEEIKKLKEERKQLDVAT